MFCRSLLSHIIQDKRPLVCSSILLSVNNTHVYLFFQNKICIQITGKVTFEINKMNFDVLATLVAKSRLLFIFYQWYVKFCSHIELPETVSRQLLLNMICLFHYYICTRAAKASQTSQIETYYFLRPKKLFKNKTPLATAESQQIVISYLFM